MMMRKLLILTLVLCLASYASAELSWSITGQTGPGGTILPGDNLTLSLDEAGDNVVAMVIDWITDCYPPIPIPPPPPPDPFDGLFTWAAVHPGFDGLVNPGMSVPDFDGMLIDMAYPPSGKSLDDWMSINATWSGAGGARGTPPTGPGILTLNYTAGAPGTYTIMGGTFGPPLPGLNAITEQTGGTVPLPALPITVVPEPMTMVLLGLGGLFLRRRE